MQILVPFLMIVFCLGLILLIRHRFVNKTYPKVTGSMLDSVDQLTEIGLQRDQNGYNGTYRNFLVYVYATTSIQRGGYFDGKKFQVWVIVAPEPGQLNGLGGFFGKYLVTGQKPGYAMIGFLVSYNAHAKPEERIKFKLDELLNALEEKGVKTYVA